MKFEEITVRPAANGLVVTVGFGPADMGRSIPTEKNVFVFNTLDDFYGWMTNQHVDVEMDDADVEKMENFRGLKPPYVNEGPLSSESFAQV